MANRSPPAPGDTEKVESRLAQAEQHIVAGEVRIARLTSLVDQLACEGRDTRGAEALLQHFDVVLAQWHARRRALLDAIWPS